MDAQMYGTDDMLCETIQRLIESHHTTVKELADVAGYAPSTIYGWLGGVSRFPADAIRAWCSRHPSITVQNAIADVMTGGRATITAPLTDDDLDVNGDGKIDLNDALDIAIGGIDHASQFLAQVRDAHVSGEVNGDTIIDIVKAETNLRRRADRARAILRHLEVNRRKAKRVPVTP